LEAKKAAEVRDFSGKAAIPQDCDFEEEEAEDLKFAASNPQRFNSFTHDSASRSHHSSLHSVSHHSSFPYARSPFRCIASARAIEG
jgi:hypothetical protein